LSITEWAPVTGVVPPLSQADWEGAFARYRETPEYRVHNEHLTLSQYKAIYWWEFAHRLLARVVGLIYAVPWLWMLVSGRGDRRLVRGTTLLVVLVCAQALVGWWMVASGLRDQPRVEPLRLAAHLLMAQAILAVTVWLLLPPVGRWPRWSDGRRGRRRLLAAAILGAVLIVAQSLLGALVAGLHAGLLSNTFPTMVGWWIPPGLWPLDPWWSSLWHDPLTVQFAHRLGGLGVLVGAAVYVALAWRVEGGLRARHLLWPALAVVQALVGIATLLGRVPIILAVMHQLLAFILLAAVILSVHAALARGRGEERSM
jgi:cytochrome c oxidase assembly protein subunit 15